MKHPALVLTGLFGVLACATKPAPSPERADAGADGAGSPAAAVVAKICAAAPCAGPMARVESWRDATGAAALFVYDGDIQRCSHPPRVWFDKDGKELAAVGSNPVPAGEEAPGPKIHARLTEGLNKGESTFCR